MSEPATEIKKSIVDIEGFESLLEVQEAELAEVQERDQEVVQEPAKPVPENYWTTDEAAKELGVSQRTIFKRLKEGSLKGFRVQGKFRQEWRIAPISCVSRVLEAAPEVQQLERNSSGSNQPTLQEPLQEEPSGSSRSPESMADLGKLLEVIREKDRLLQAATFRNGYLEAQLEGRDKEIKLLTDSQHKPAGWRKFWSWFTGR